MERATRWEGRWLSEGFLESALFGACAVTCNQRYHHLASHRLQQGLPLIYRFHSLLASSGWISGCASLYLRDPLMSVTPSSSRAPPAEEDLLDLYNLVWASYVEDPIAPGSATPSPPPPPLPTTSSRDRDMVYNPLPAGGDLKRYPSATAIPPHVAGAQGKLAL